MKATSFWADGFLERLLSLAKWSSQEGLRKGLQCPCELRRNHQKQRSGVYYDPRELKYGTKAKTFLSLFDFDKLSKRKVEIVEKGGDERFVKLSLLSWNVAPLFFLALDKLSSMENSLLELASSLDLSDFTKEAIDHSLLYSEIDGSLSVEGISIPQKRMVELIQEDAEPINRNDLIVKNMAKGNDFVLAKPPFDERNLTHLYALLSNGCLDDEVQLLTGNLYRHDEVEIDHYQECLMKKSRNAWIPYSLS